MNKEVKKDWLNALRSGKYKQGQGKLRDNDCFCCLGVLCDIIEPDKWEKTDFGFIHGNQKYTLHSDTLNNNFGLSLEASNKVEKLMAMNDSGKSFEEIANYIEKTL